MFEVQFKNEIYGSAGIDAYTVTSKQFEGRAAILAAFEMWRDNECGDMPMREWRALRYKGWQVQGVHA